MELINFYCRFHSVSLKGVELSVLISRKEKLFT